jgi:hypothetical protein
VLNVPERCHVAVSRATNIRKTPRIALQVQGVKESKSLVEGDFEPGSFTYNIFLLRGEQYSGQLAT